MNKCIQTRIDDQREDHPDPERSPKRNHIKQLLTHNVPTDDVENTKAQIREKIYYSMISCRLFPGEQKGYSKQTRGTGELLDIN